MIAFNRGSVPEIVEDGLTGFVVGDEEEAVAATDGLSRLSRGAIRQRFEERFTARRMAAIATGFRPRIESWLARQSGEAADELIAVFVRVFFVLVRSRASASFAKRSARRRAVLAQMASFSASYSCIASAASRARSSFAVVAGRCSAFFKSVATGISSILAV